MPIRPSIVGRRFAHVVTLAGVSAWVLAALPAAALAQTESGSEAQPGANAAGPATVAIAPFENLSGSTADDWIGAGIAESLSADFLRLMRLRLSAVSPARDGSLPAGISAWAIGCA